MYAQERPKKNNSSSSARKPPPQSSSRRPLISILPETTLGERLAAIFCNPWDWIYSPLPPIGNKPDWETISNYYLSSIELFSYHQDPQSLIGIRPSLSTRWGVIDLDRPSKYHPANNPLALQLIHNALENIGITRTLINQSSHSGGLHIYIPLPEAINSYDLSITLKYNLEAAGIQIKSGQCEIFPNPKRYIPKGKGYSHYNGIRLPMQPQTGFIPLDNDLNPLPLTLEGWLDRFDLAAAQQDIPKLKRQIEDAKLNRKSRSHCDPHSIDTWRNRIDQEKTQGWTGPGQTNEKLKAFGCEARVFLGMDSVQQIAQYIQETAQNSPGFHQHSNHTQDIAQRSQDIAKWAKSYYWPLGTPATRETGYHTPPTPIASFSYHQAKREAAQHRIREAVAQLIAQNTLAPSASERAEQIIKLGNISKKTLYLSVNKALWHPAHLPAKEQPKTEIEQASFQPTPKPEKKEQLQPPERLQKGHCLDLFKYVGFVILNLLLGAAVALTPEGQKAAQAAILPAEPPNRGGLGGNSTTIAPPVSNWNDLKATLPEPLQRKIAQAERQRQRDQERETQRRQRAESRQLLLTQPPLPENTSPEQPPENTPRLVVPILGPFPQAEPQQRPPTLAEQQEFETWYALAQQFKLVTDHHWDGREYWVETHTQWQTYCELSGSFTTRRLRQYLGHPPHSESSISKDV